MYSGNIGLLVDYFKNTSTVDDYIWRYRSYVYGSHLLYNLSTNSANGNVGIVIFNRDKLNAAGWKVAAGHTVRHLTTAEEVSSSTFAFPGWTISPAYVSSISNDFGSFSYTRANYRSDGSHPATPSIGTAYDAEMRLATFYDGDNKETTTSDNKGELECRRVQIRWCGDGILETARGEVCDNGLAN